MVSCCQRAGIEQQFGRVFAERELRRFRRRGPTRTTRLLIEELRSEGVADASLLDVGGGIGAIHHALLDAGVTRATHVDVSSAYLALARDEAERRHHADRVRFLHGDFVELAPELPDADVVTLDRVICCYPDMESLVERSAAKARRLYAAAYPLRTWWMRAGFAAANLLMRLRRSTFRLYLHPPDAIDAALRRQGLEPRRRRRTLAWEIAVYVRQARSHRG